MERLISPEPKYRKSVAETYGFNHVELLTKLCLVLIALDTHLQLCGINTYI